MYPIIVAIISHQKVRRKNSCLVSHLLPANARTCWCVNLFGGALLSFVSPPLEFGLVDKLLVACPPRDRERQRERVRERDFLYFL